MTTYWKCCPVPCFDDCCEWWDACDPPLPTSVSVTFKKKCTRNYYDENRGFLSAVTWHDTVEVYTATNWSLQTIPGQCGENGLPYFKSSTVNYKLTGTRKIADPIFPANVSAGGGGDCAGTNVRGCTLCDENFQCDWPDPLTWCWEVEETYDVDGIVPDYSAEIVCCEDEGCFRPCLNFESLFDQSYLDGTVDTDYFCCGNTTPPSSGPFTTAHDEFTVSGKCGCLAGDSWNNIKLISFLDQWGGPDTNYSGYYKWSTDSGIYGGLLSGFYYCSFCECQDFTVSPPVWIINDCGCKEWYIQDICEYELIVAITT
jgi:hypothetical protein